MDRYRSAMLIALCCALAFIGLRLAFRATLGVLILMSVAIGFIGWLGVYAVTALAH